MFWALQLVIVLVPGAIFHLYAACKRINQECILQKPIYTVIYILSVLLRISLEVVAFWLQIHLFGFKVKPLYLCDVVSLGKKFTIIKCMVPEHFEKTIFLIAMYTFTVITIVLCVAEIFEITLRRYCFLIRQWQKGWLLTAMPQLFINHFYLVLSYSLSISISNINNCSLNLPQCVWNLCLIENTKFLGRDSWLNISFHFNFVTH